MIRWTALITEHDVGKETPPSSQTHCQHGSEDVDDATLVDDTEATHSLEATIVERDAHIARMQREAQEEQERRRMSQEGAAAWTRYLESMLRSLHADASGAQAVGGDGWGRDMGGGGTP